MVSFRNAAIAASALLSLATAAPAEKVARQFTPGVLNNTQEFYIHMFVTDGDTTYTNWACKFPYYLLFNPILYHNTI
jgi:hypothetical protein